MRERVRERERERKRERESERERQRQRETERDLSFHSIALLRRVQPFVNWCLERVCD